jgi:hypothetical protein
MAAKFMFRAIRGRLRTVYLQTHKNHHIEWHVWNTRKIFDLVILILDF